MEYQSSLASSNRTFDYSNLQKYSGKTYGTGVTAPVFSVYAFGTQFVKNTKPVSLCQPAYPLNNPQTFYGNHPYSTMSEFDKMLRQKKY